MRAAIKDYGDTNFITGMRAFAAFAVVLIHTGGAGLRSLGEIGNNLADLGRTGVYVFFVISGFSVASSFEASGSYADYLNKRLWRIAPLYFFWIVIAAAFWLDLNVPLNELAYNILMHMAFLSFLDYKITNSILGVEWSIPIEVFWYFIVPFLMPLIRGGKTIWIAIFTAFLAYRFAVTHPDVLPVAAAHATEAMHWSPLPYLLSYCLGVSALKIRQTLAPPKHLAGLVFALALTLLFATAIQPNAVNRVFFDEFVFISAITFMLIAFGSDKSTPFRLLFSNRPILYLGAISYGIYLSHVVLTGKIAPHTENLSLRFLIVACTTTVVASLTYYLIERPGILLGRRTS